MRNIKITLFAALIYSAAYSQPQSDFPEPYGAIPSARQLKWHETEMYCLIHFTPTTFQNKEWGYGDADPAIFNPAKFDALQIVEAAKSGGFKGIVFVAKHHDGFALWPTKSAGYNISESPWKNGKGDMVREFMLAAKQKGLKFGIYCSPWDRNNPAYGSPAYITVYRNQLRELYSNYGPLFISWHDGANGGDGFYGGRKESRKVDQSGYYDWLTTWKMTRELQPDASIFSDIGPDIRWVGNEKGIAPETSWSTITLKGKGSKSPMPGFLDDANLGSGTRNGKQWIPFEGDVALRPGWFYHPEEDGETKSAAQLFNIYCNSVGRGGGFDLGLSPTTEGLLHPDDVKTLAEFGKILKQVFTRNMAEDAKITLSGIRNNNVKEFGPGNLTDNDRYSYWATDDNVHNATATLTFKQPVKFNLIRLRENIKLGQRIDSIRVETFRKNKWMDLARATSIGANRIIKLETPEISSKIRVRIYAPVCIALSEIGIFQENISATKARQSLPAGYNQSSWKIKTMEQGTLELDLGHEITFSAIGYMPLKGKSTAEFVEKYQLSVSSDGKNWKNIAEGEFSNIKANPILQRIRLPKNTTGRYIRLSAKQYSVAPELKAGFDVEEITLYP